MFSNIKYWFIISSLAVFLLACDSKNSDPEISGRWKVVKAEIDGYSVTNQYTEPYESWLYFDKEGMLLGGKEMSDHYGSWKLLPGAKLHLNSSSPKWNNTSWNLNLVDSVLYLKGTRSSNNYTQKLWLIPAESEVPQFRLVSEHDRRLTGTWNLLRIKKNSKLIDLIKDPTEQEVQITFLTSGIYNSTLPGEDQIAGSGIWNLDEHDLKLSLFPFKDLNNKSWNYAFTGDILRLSSTENLGYSSLKWEWLWQKSSSTKNEERFF